MLVSVIWRRKLLAFSALAMLGVCLLLVKSHSALAANPQVISFQGKVVNADGTNVTNGSYSFDFVLYDDPSLGSPSDGVHDKWHELSKSVTVTDGVFQTNLGSATPLPDFNANPSLYLAVRFNGDAAGYMSPRIQMGSVPYALNSDSLGGLSKDGFVQLSPSTAQTGFIDIDGDINFGGILQSVASLELDSAVGTAITIGDSGSGNYFRLDGTTREPTLNGSARHARTITLSPEYGGATLTGDGSNNSGIMTSDFCSGTSLLSINTGVCTASAEEHNYYAWTANATNDFDIWVLWQVPSDFASFATSPAVNFYGWRTSSSDSVTLNIYKQAASACASANLSGTAGQWNNTTVATTGCNVVAGDQLLLNIHLSVGVTSEFTRVGEIKINYLSKW